VARGLAAQSFFDDAGQVYLLSPEKVRPLPKGPHFFTCRAMLRGAAWPWGGRRTGGGHGLAKNAGRLPLPRR